jgi:hypothetical protein
MASLSLHHIASRRTRLTLYRRVRAALEKSGVLVSADCHPAALAPFAADGMRAWRAHLAHRYGPRKAAAFLRAWAREDFYVPLDVELRLLQTAGFEVDVAWRRNPFAVIVGQPRSARNHKRGTA